MTRRRIITIIVLLELAGLAGFGLWAWQTGNWPTRQPSPTTPPSHAARRPTPASQPASAKLVEPYRRPDNAPTLVDVLAGDVRRAVNGPVGWTEALVIAVGTEVTHSPIYWRFLGKVALDDGQPAEAERFFQRAYAINPKSPATQIGLGLVAMAREHYEDAEAWLAAACQADPANIEARYDLGVAQLRQRHRHQAEATFRGVLTSQPDHFNAQYNLAGIATYFGRPLEMRVEWEKCVKLRPTSLEARYQLGLAYLKSTLYREAIEQFEAAHKLAPKDADVLNNLGLAYQGDKNDEAALRCYEQAYQLSPNKLEIIRNLADYHLTLHQRDPLEKDHIKQAIRLWERCQALDPNDNWVSNMLKYFRTQQEEK